MKGLLLKDFFVFKKNCTLYLLAIIGFIVASAFIDGSFYILYPCIFAGMIPVTLMAYDEQSKWNQYCGTLPCSKTMIVSEKYLIGLFTQIATLLLSGVVQSTRLISGDIGADAYLFQMITALFTSLVLPSFVLPVMFRLGVEKGRIVYILLIVVVAIMCFGVIEIIQFPATPDLTPSGLSLLVLCPMAVGIYVLSWLLSVAIYKKKEDL